MKTKTLGALVCIFAFLVAVAAVAEDKGPATIKLDINGKGKAVQAFPHHKHQENADLKGKCKTCHHDVKGAAASSNKCGTCHTKPSAKDDKSGAPGFMKSMHKACQDCHKKQKDKPELKACKACHGK